MSNAPELTLDFVYEPWRNSGLCMDLAGVTFFPASYDSMAVARAKAICVECPVADECLTFALDTRQPEGIWGGKTPQERLRIRRRRSRDRRRSGKLTRP